MYEVLHTCIILYVYMRYHICKYIVLQMCCVILYILFTDVYICTYVCVISEKEPKKVELGVPMTQCNVCVNVLYQIYKYI